MRAADGHPELFPLEFVEVGNGDFFDRSGSYEWRFAQFFDAIKATYPQLKVIATDGGEQPRRRMSSTSTSTRRRGRSSAWRPGRGVRAPPGRLFA